MLDKEMNVILLVDFCCSAAILYFSIFTGMLFLKFY